MEMGGSPARMEGWQAIPAAEMGRVLQRRHAVMFVGNLLSKDVSQVLNWRQIHGECRLANRNHLLTFQNVPDRYPWPESDVEWRFHLGSVMLVLLQEGWG